MLKRNSYTRLQSAMHAHIATLCKVEIDFRSEDAEHDADLDVGRQNHQRQQSSIRSPSIRQTMREVCHVQTRVPTTCACPVAIGASVRHALLK